jgi:hypothetical protein
MITVGDSTTKRALAGVAAMGKWGAMYLMPRDNPTESRRTLRIKIAVFMQAEFSW